MRQLLDLNSRRICGAWHLLVLVALMSLIGCQSLRPTQDGELTLNNSEFMTLWEKYNECASGHDATHMQAAVTQLHSAPRPVSIYHSPIPIPQFLADMATSKGSRLAVDPRAMAASCALQAGESATASGNYELAQRLYQFVLNEYPEPDYAYYVTKAESALATVPTIRHVSRF